MKFLSAFMLCLFAMGMATAQVTTSARAGVSFASLHYKTDYSTQGRIAGYGGISVNIELQKQLFFQPELLYSLRGYRFPATGFASSGRVGYGYITVPLLAGYKPSKNFSLIAGPELGYLVRARSYYDGTSHDILNMMGKRFNVDATAGVAWNVTPELSVEARFSFGVTALYRGVLTDDMGNEIGRLNDGFHRVLQFGLAYTL